ncbi:MAG: amidohydrolase family protein [Bacteroidota bacterium]|jgi:N-acyl-D-aspartate/D-glutamate deacylase
MEFSWKNSEGKLITRREFFGKLAFLGLVPVYLSAKSNGLGAFSTEALSERIPEEIFETSILNAKCWLDNQWKVINVGIYPDGTMFLSEVPLMGKNVIDAGGKILSPGFIDILADNALNPKDTWLIFEKYKLSDGCTTALQMHGGSSDCKDYYGHFLKKQHYINYGVSTFVMELRYGIKNKESRLKAVEENLEAGALGVSHSIEYQPTPYNEILDYAKLAAKYQRPFFLHLRYSDAKNELKGVSEAINIAREANVHVHLNHLHSTGGTYNMSKALDLIRDGIKSGLSLSCCVYPFSYWATYLPSRRFDEGWKDRYKIDYEDLTVVGTGETLTKESFDRYRKGHNRLVAVPEGTMDLSKTVDLALNEDFCMIGSDGGIEAEPRANNHPRGASCFSTSLRHSIKIGLPIEKMIEKMTLLPKNLIGSPMKKRGELKTGSIADLVLFDPEKIKGSATVANPNQFSGGIEAVWVNGALSYQNKKLIDTKGVAIKY